jgi:hypothetical protein
VFLFADPRRGKRNPSRWFEPIEKNNFEQELPAEWEGMYTVVDNIKMIIKT